jgi:Peptidyl-prolyl cis-trans isomerase (rotamase) - cyclophilin family
MATMIALVAVGVLFGAEETQKRSEAAKPRVKFITDAGEFVVELDPERAPKTASNFLAYVDKGFYDGGTFHRTVTLDNQPNNKVKIEVAQAAADSKREKEFPNAIPLERTRDTKLKHVAGTISMARERPDSARDEFFVCLTDQPELDFGGKRNPDGQGFAAFGRVVEGMETIRKIHCSKNNDQTLTPKIVIRSSLRLR